MAWLHRPMIQPGQPWESGEFWITPHQGGWAKGIEVYRDYVKQVRSEHRLPDHVRDGLGYQTIWMMQASERHPSEAAFRFSDFPRIAADAKAHGIGEVVFWGACRYFELPIPLRPELGTEEEFLSGLRQAKQVGVNVTPFISVKIIRNSRTDLLTRYGAAPGAANWSYHPDFIPNFTPYYVHDLEGPEIATFNKPWLADVEADLNRWIGKGVYSFSWDVWKDDGAIGGVSLVEAITRIRQSARKHDPQSTFSGECHQIERDGGILDYCWNWGDYMDLGPILSVLKMPRLNCGVEASASVAKMAFCDGLYLNIMPRKPDCPNGTALIGEKPELSRTLKQLAPLRRQFLPFFVEGVFLGDSVLSEKTPAFVRGHQLGNRLLVFVLNNQSQAAKFTVASDLENWLPKCGEYEAKRYDAEGKLVETWTIQGPRWRGMTPTLPGEDLTVFKIASKP